MQPDAWTYCHYCGGVLKDETLDSHSRHVCTRCDRVIYRNPVPAAGCVVEQAGRVLLVRRKRDPWKDYWCFPAGFVEYDEDVEHAAVREVREETSPDVPTDSIFGASSYFDDPRQNGVAILFHARVGGGKLRAGDDARDVGFFSIDGLPGPIAISSHRRALANRIEHVRVSDRRRNDRGA